MEPVRQATDPISGLVAALRHRDPEALRAALSVEAVLDVPPLHLTLTGREEIVSGVGRVLAAFGDLSYRTRSRYLAPGIVTDEATIEGTQTGDFLGTPGSGEHASLPLRVIARHSDAAVTALTIYPDVGSLRAIGGATARLIDLTATNLDSSSSLVAALRASITDEGSRVIVGTARDASAAPGARPAEVLGEHGPGAAGAPRPARAGGAKASKKPQLKAPLPRRVRRRRAIVAGTAMLVASIIIVTWVTMSVLRAAGDPGSTRASTAVTPGPGGSSATGGPGATSGAPSLTASTAPPTAGGSSTPTQTSSVPAPTATFDAAHNQYTFPSDLLFPWNKSTLTPQALTFLATVVSKVRAEGRFGTIKVVGYTDNTGTRTYNLRLSKRRADAVAAVLRQELSDVNVTVTTLGLGESDSVGDNGTPAGQAKNRRVTITVPPATR